jgi:hypothetical protein
VTPRGIQPITRKRTCTVCGELFETPHAGSWPPQYCSQKCHRVANPKAKPKPLRAVSPASTSQRVRVAGRACLVCATSPCHPAHLIDKSLAADLGDARAVVPLCARCHRAYDEERLSILEYLEPHYRPELAFAVERVGLLATLRRVTNEAWAPAAGETERAA